MTYGLSHYNRNRKRYLERKKNKLCVVCGLKNDRENKVLCSKCNKKRKTYKISKIKIKKKRK